MSEIQETRLFYSFFVVAITICILGIAMTNNPPLHWINGHYALLGSDPYQVCQHLIGKKPAQYENVAFCLQENTETDWNILYSRAQNILASCAIFLLLVQLVVKPKRQNMFRQDLS